MGAFVQIRNSRLTGPATSYTQSYNSLSVIGNTSIVAVMLQNTTGVAPVLAVPIAGNAGNSYNQIGSGWFGPIPVSGFYWFVQLYAAYIAALPGAGNMSVTVTVTVAQRTLALGMLEASGIAVLNPADAGSFVNNLSPVAGSTNMTLAPLIRNPNEFAVAAVIGQSQPAAGPGWTITNPGNFFFALAYQPVIPTGSAIVTPATQALGSWGALMAGLLPTGAIDSGSLLATENSSVASANAKSSRLYSGPLLAIENSAVAVANPTETGIPPKRPKKNRWPGGWPGGGW